MFRSASFLEGLCLLCQPPATDTSSARRLLIQTDVVFEALLIGGRSGVGKTTVGWEVSVQLQAAEVAHCLVEGDNLDQAFPAPPDDPHRSRMTEANLAALWGNYAALGYCRLVYTNTVSVLEPDLIARAGVPPLLNRRVHGRVWGDAPHTVVRGVVKGGAE